jgi:hypothetical protein
MLASYIQGRKGQLSLFHTVAAAHLAQLTFVSGAAEIILDYDSNEKITANSAEGSFLFQTLLNFFYTLFIAFIAGGGHCALVDSDENGFNRVQWILLFGIHTRGQGVTFSPIGAFYIFFLAYCIVAGIYACIMERKMPLRKENWVLEWGFIGTLLLFGVCEIVSIECSLRINAGLDDSAENEWGFGQVSSKAHCGR